MPPSTVADMADSEDNTRRQSSSPIRPASKRARPRSQAFDQPADHSLMNPKKSLKRSTAVASSPSERSAPDQLPSHANTMRELAESVLPVPASTSSVDENVDSRTVVRPSSKDANTQAKWPPAESSSPSNKLATSLLTDSQDSSVGSETVARVSPVGRDGSGKGPVIKPRKPSTSKPNALNFLDSDSPVLTTESIQRTVKEASKPSPETAKATLPSAHGISSASSGFREDLFDVFVDHDNDPSTSPRHSADGDPRGSVPDEAVPRATRTAKGRNPSYSTPETPRGSVSYPHMTPEDLTPRASNQRFVKHVPRTEKLPLTGYELLASRLSATSAGGGGFSLRPIYRRFETLNHRILLHLQDEISELEEQLRRLDTTDTQNRRLPNGILPASRRTEYMPAGDLQWHKTDVLGKIGFKLEQYNRVLSSFRQTLSLPAPMPADLSHYRGFLANYAPISEAETQFLDATDDLVYLGYSDDDMAADEEDMATPISRSDIVDFHSRRRVSMLSHSDISHRHEERSTPSSDTANTARDQQHATDKHLVARLSLAATVAVILPILTFLVIPGFIGRMTVVCLVGPGVVGGLVQAKVIRFQASTDFCLGVGLYGGVMAVLAGVIG
ncbi:hypothetical protein F4802DRAFT_216338 [Xylaria palmicola]|nr:hypothetical protein F4802DRAFT_216338 [Xylaria palmicola]